jgi:hypothetical protein
MFTNDEQHDHSAPVLPERALLLETLDRAIRDLCVKMDKFDRLDALSWIEDPSTAPFSFSWVCEHLGFDTERMRKELRKRAALTRPESAKVA